jgi:hypothetical protein
MTFAMALLYQCEEGGEAGGRFLVPQHETAGLTPLFTAPSGPQTSTALQHPNGHKKTRRYRAGSSKDKAELLQLDLFVFHVLTCLGIKFHDQHFVGRGFLVLGGRVKVTGAGSGFQLDFLASAFSHVRSP